ncbi:MAG TPA: bifunctional oligoribonuclease/PAP phosphatase NrnA [Longimicrobiales bacterium]
MSEPTIVPEARRGDLTRLGDAFAAATDIVLTTHVNADGDGAGSEAALAAWLAARGKRVAIVNPTPFPAAYRHLITDPDQVGDPGSERAAWAIERAELFVVLDTNEPRRLGKIARAFGERPVVVIDHHPPSESAIPGDGLRDPTACATGELVYDLLQVIDPGIEPWPPFVAEAIYTAILTDTGSFRFANTTPRAHRIVADLIERGVDPEAVYRRLFASVPLRRIRLLQAALGRLEADPDLPVTWITVPRAVTAELSATSEDLDGIVEYARSIEGTEVALLFRETPDGATKVSLRSNGEVDVNAVARRFGGGGHVKAAGALIGMPLAVAREDVLEATRAAVRELESRREPS